MIQFIKEIIYQHRINKAIKKRNKYVEKTLKSLRKNIK